MDKTCGIYLIDGTKKLLLIGHVTNFGSSFSIPKGMLDEGEDEWEAAKRELLEETGIDYDSLRILHNEELDEIKYQNVAKVLKPWIVVFEPTDEMPHPYCESTFVDEKTGKELPEIDYFLWVTIEDAYNYLGHVQKQHLDKVAEVVELINI